MTSRCASIVLTVVPSLFLLLNPAKSQELGSPPSLAPNLATKRLDDIEKQLAEIKAAALPKGTVIFMQTTSCPAGFLEMIAARGRYIVGVGAGGEVGGQIGAPLRNKERRNVVAYHTHTIDPAQLAHTHPVNASKLNYYVDANGAAEGAHLPISEVPNSGPAAFEKTLPETYATGLQIDNDAAINAPYIQLLSCVKG